MTDTHTLISCVGNAHTENSGVLFRGTSHIAYMDRQRENVENTNIR